MIEISIIIPHYNSANSIIRLLESIPQLDWLEIIIIDDHSDQEIYVQLEHVVKKYAKCKLFKNELGKKGAGSARNYGIENSSGTWLLFADADDFFIPKFEKIISNYIKVDADLVVFSPTSMSESGVAGRRHLAYKTRLKKYVSSNDIKYLFKFYVVWSKMVSRKLLMENNISFDEVIASNDVMFSLKSTYYAKKILAVDDEIYCVTDSENSLTKSTATNVLLSRFDVACNYNEFLRKKLTHPPMVAMGLHLWYALRYIGVKEFFRRMTFIIKNRYPII